MASGSQTCSGNWALLPMIPQKINRPEVVRSQGGILWATAAAFTVAISRSAVEDGQEDQAHEEADIPEAGDHEGLFTGFRGGEFLVPEADEEVRGQAHQLPGDVQLQQAAGNHQGEHGQGEERQVGVKAAEARVARHVADGVDLNQPADGGHDHEHHQAGGVQKEAEGHLDEVGDQPVEVVDDGCRPPPSLKKKVQAIIRGMVEAIKRDGQRQLGIIPGEDHDQGEGRQRQNDRRANNPSRIGSHEHMINP